MRTSPFKTTSGRLGVRALVLFALLVFAFLRWQPANPPAHQDGGQPDERPRVEAPRADVPSKSHPTPSEDPFPQPERPARAERPKVEFHDLTIRDEQGKAAYRGTVDLTETLDRIDAGRRLRFANDGSVFQNREGRLPRKPAGHYREFVHPTPGLGGPGPQRVVVGADGEIYYTADHYKTFQKVEGREASPPRP